MGRLPLRRERRFSRSYGSKEQNLTSQVSRFMDSSASMSASERLREWPTWTDDERTEFCQGSDWLHQQADFPEMLRFIMRQAMQHNGAASLGALLHACRRPRLLKLWSRL
jgi:hypothetical protein